MAAQPRGQVTDLISAAQTGPQFLQHVPQVHPHALTAAGQQVGEANINQPGHAEAATLRRNL